jgi:hypothetical protein
MIFEDTFSTSTKPTLHLHYKRQVQFREITAVYTENLAKPMIIFCG